MSDSDATDSAVPPELEEVIERFEDAWQQGAHPRIEDYLPGQGTAPALLAELVHIDLERRCKAGERARVEDYLRRFPELTAQAKALAGLLAAERRLSQQGKPEPMPEAEAHRFPEGRTELVAELDPPTSALPAQGGPAAAHKLRFDFLAPAQAPGERGRLGPYAVLKVVAGSSLAIVFQALDPKRKRLVALKVLRPSLAASALHRQLFLRQAQAAAIPSEHLVHIQQIGEERGIPFVAMPFLKGETLQDRLRQESPLAVPEALRVGREIALGLTAAHAGGVFRRDLAPAHICLEGPQQCVKVLLFGIVQALAASATPPAPGADTAGYLAPECICTAEVDARCDLFSLGSLLYRMLTGTLPFVDPKSRNDSTPSTWEEPRPPRDLAPAVPAALSDLVLKLLAQDRAQRPATAREVAEALGSSARD